MTKRPTKRHSRRAMTLVEVLAVVVILGLLAGTLAIGFGGAFSKGKQELAKTGIGIIFERLEMYKLEHDRYPDNSIGLGALTDGEAEPSDSYYLAPDRLADPWGNPYYLIVPGPNGHPFEILSYGEDGTEGGTGPARDISSINLRGDDG
ncbi:MAG: type II secretion system protein GspG [Planctomycetota bacterium]